MSLPQVQISPAQLRRLLAQLRGDIPPTQFLKGVPVFWDDFEKRPAGFIKEDYASGDVVGASPDILGYGVGNGWTWADGNEYSCYVTSEAAYRGSKSLRLGGNQSVYNTSAGGDVGVQDLAVAVAVPSGIVGVEYVINFANAALSSPKGLTHLLSIENRQRVATNPSFYEMWLQIPPLASNLGYAAVFPNNVLTTILSNTVPDSNGQYLLGGLTSPDVKNKGQGNTWHRIAFVVDAVNGEFLDVYIDRYYIDCRSIGIGKWRTVSGALSGPFDWQDGTFRIELHAMRNTGSIDPVFYIDDVVITDEGGFVKVP